MSDGAHGNLSRAGAVSAKKKKVMMKLVQEHSEKK